MSLCWSLGWLVSWLVGPYVSVCRKVLKGREVKLPCSYRSTCYQYWNKTKIINNKEHAWVCLMLTCPIYLIVRLSDCLYVIYNGSTSSLHTSLHPPGIIWYAKSLPSVNIVIITVRACENQQTKLSRTERNNQKQKVLRGAIEVH